MKPFHFAKVALLAGGLALSALSANSFADVAVSGSAVGAATGSNQLIANSPGMASESTNSTGFGLDQSQATGTGFGLLGTTPPSATHTSIGFGNCQTNGNVQNNGLGGIAAQGNCAGVGAANGNAMAQ